MKAKTMLIALLFLNSSGMLAQSYSLKTSILKYKELEKPIMIHLDSTPYTVMKKIPFTFKAFGKSVNLNKDTGTVMSSSFMLGITSKDSAIAFSPFYGAYVSVRSRDSSISYEITGEAPKRILKFQWKNALLKGHLSTEYANFQVWLQEADNRICFHIGPNHIIGNRAFKIGASDSLVQVNGPQIGIYVVDLQGNWSNKVELTGNSKNPGLTKKFPDEGVTGVPASNTLYTFTPSLY